MIHDSKSRSKRYYQDLSKPHIALSKYDRVFVAFGAGIGNNENLNMNACFVSKLNSEIAKS